MAKERRHPGVEGVGTKYDLESILEEAKAYQENHKLSKEWERKETKEGKVLCEPQIPIKLLQEVVYIRFRTG